MKQADVPIVVKQHFNASRKEVWEAITWRDKMVKWFFEQIETFEAREGFETRFTVKNEGRRFLHLWKITEVEPGEKITYNWKYAGYQGDSFVTFILEGKTRGCELTLTHRVTEDFPDDVPELTRESCIGGWKWFIQNRLKDYFEKKQ